MLNLLIGAPYLINATGITGRRMTSFRPTELEQFALEAKLNRFFGAKIYDRVFPGFEVLEIVDDELRAWSPSEHCAAVIDVHYAARVAYIARTVFDRPVRRVSVLVRGLSHTPVKSRSRSLRP
jgi:hypothetical protein